MDKLLVLAYIIVAAELVLGIWQALERAFIVAICCFVFAIISAAITFLIKRSQTP